MKTFYIGSKIEFFFLEFFFMFNREISNVESVFPTKLKENEVRIIYSLRGFEKLVINENEFNEIYYNISYLKEWFKDGQIAFCFFYRKKLVHISWLVMEPSVEEKRKQYPPLPPKTDFEKVGYIHGCSTTREYWGLGVYPHVLSIINNYLKQRGLKQSVLIILKGNVASIKSAENVGFRKDEKINNIRLVSKDWFTYKSL